jgi:hypothetical protein
MGRKHYVYAVLDDREIEVELEVTVHSWGRPETPPAYAHGGLPAEGPEVEITDAWLVEDGKNAPSILPSLTDAELERFAVEFVEAQ